MSETKLQWALAMAQRGLGVFPIKEGAKFPPLIEAWPDRATVDREQIVSWWTRWPEANIGVHCRDHIVIDVDVKNGKPGLESLKALDIDLNTLTVRTPTGGLHVYFKGPNVKNSVGTLGPGLDVRSDHGYVLGPGSITADGSYRLNGRASGLLEAPACITVSGLGPTPGPRLVSAVDLDAPEAVARAQEFLGQAAPAVEGAGGDVLTFKTAAVLKDYGVSEFTAWELMAEYWNPRCSPPWDEDELRRKVENAYRYGERAPGAESPEAQFADVRIEPPAAKPSGPWFNHGDQLSLKASWLFPRLLPMTGVCLVVGPTGAGKTFLVLEKARCLAKGIPFFGVTPKHTGGTAFLFAGTEGSGFAWRLAALEEPELLPISYRPVGGLYEKGALDRLVEDLKARSAWMELMFGAPLRMVVLETLSASGLIEKENDNQQAAQAIHNLGQISAMLGVLFVVTHHPPKDGEGTRGASAIPSNSDYVIEIGRRDRARVRDVALTKARNTEERNLGTFSLVPVEIGKDEDGEPIVSMKVTTGDVALAAREEQDSWCRLLIECVEHALIDEENKKVEIDGYTMVNMNDVRELFWIRSGIADKNNAGKKFRPALAKAGGLGLIRDAPYLGGTYLCLKQIT